MAMTKAEKEVLENALTAAAFRRTAPVAPDVPPPERYSDKLSTGFAVTGGRNELRVVPACSSSVGHSIGNNEKTTSHGSRHLFSSKVSALRSARFEIEEYTSRILRAIDIQIENELNSNPKG